MSEPYTGAGQQPGAEQNIFDLMRESEAPASQNRPIAPTRHNNTTVYDAQNPQPRQPAAAAQPGGQVSPGVLAARQRAPAPSTGDLFGATRVARPAAAAAPPAPAQAARPAANTPRQPASSASRPRPRDASAQKAQAASASRQPSASGAGGGKPPANKQGGNGGSGNGGGKSRPPKRPSVAKKVMLNLLKAAFVLCCLGLVVASIFALSVVSYVVEATENDDDILDLERISGSSTGYIMALNPDNPNAEAENDWIEIQKIVGESNTIWVPIDEIPPYMRNALISTEDKEFLEHKGFSIRRTVFAALNEVFHFRQRQGGSTLDQQLVKNLTGEKVVVGSDGDTTAGYLRKLREIYRAWCLNKNYSKDMILEAYFNTMPLSGTIVGVRAGAAEYYYTEDLNTLTLAQCATIVGITNHPVRYNPYLNPENCINRRNYVLGEMLKDGNITQAEHDAAVAEPLGLYEGERESTSTKDVNSYFIDEIYRAVLKDLQQQKGYSEEMAFRTYYNGGLRIYATVDLTLQEKMDAVYLQGFGDQAEGYIFPDSEYVELTTENSDGSTTTETIYPQSAMVVLGYDGALKGVVGGLGEKQGDLELNRATMSLRQVGSTMKPISAYALGIEGGYIDYGTTIDDAGVKPGSPPRLDPETGEVLNTWPRNYEGLGSGAPTPVADALAKSLNTVAVRVGMRVGVDNMYEFLTDTLQISSLVGEGAVSDRDLAPLVLGAMTYGISPYELAAAYQMFGNGGVYNTPHCYTRVEDSFGNLVMEPQVTSIQAISPETAYVMNRLLSNVLRSSRGSITGINGTANGMAPEYMDSIGKTGTTSEDKDRWFVGLTPYYVGVVWWGYDVYIEEEGFDGISWRAGAKTNPPVIAWKRVMEEAQASLEYKEFPEMPSGVTTETFCRESGLLVTADCPDTQSGYYTSARIPSQCYLHGEFAFPTSEEGETTEGQDAA